jgi:hypothetical protein
VDKHGHKTPKKPRKRRFCRSRKLFNTYQTPETVKKTIEMYLAGATQEKIAMTLGVDRKTVLRIVHSPEATKWVDDIQGMLRGMFGEAVGCIFMQLRRGNAEMGYRLLKDFSVIPNPAMNLNVMPPAA